MNRTVYVPWLLPLDISNDVYNWIANLSIGSYVWDASQRYITFKYEEDAIAFKLRFPL